MVALPLVVYEVPCRARGFTSGWPPQPHYSPNPPGHPWRHDAVWKRGRLTELGPAGQ